MARLVAVLALGSLLAGCGAGALTFAPLASLKPPAASKYPGAPAVVLTEELSSADFVGRRLRHSQLQVHQAVAILSAAGLKYASVKIQIGDDERLASFQARTVTPDGVIHPVDASQVFTAKMVGGAASQRGDVQFRVFQFPGVSVGSVIEYVYSLESTRVPTFRWRHIDPTLPIERYRARLSFNGYLRPDARAFNTPAQFRAEKDFDGITLSLELGPLPGLEGGESEEADAPRWRETDVWWASRIKGYEAPLEYVNWAEDWPTALSGFAREVFLKDGLGAGAESVRLDPAQTARCARDARCLIDLAVAWIRERTELTTIDERKPRKIVDVATSHRASSVEKVLVLRHILDGAGVQACVALLSKGARKAVGRDFPSPAVHDGVMVYLPAQPGLAQPLWINPSCEHCAVGEVPPWDAGAEAIAVCARDKALGAFEVRTRFEVVPGRSRPSEIRRRFAVTLGAEGAAEVEEDESRSGWVALTRRLEMRELSATAQRERAEHALGERLAGAHLRDHRLDSDRAAGTSRERSTYAVPGYAAVDGPKLAVPLTLFHAAYSKLPAIEQRRSEVLFPDERTLDEALVLRLPAGYAVAELPPPLEVSTRAASARLEAVRTGDTVTIRRVLVEHAGRYPRADYAEIAALRRTFAGFRGALLVLVRQ